MVHGGRTREAMVNDGSSEGNKVRETGVVFLPARWYLFLSTVGERSINHWMGRQLGLVERQW